MSDEIRHKATNDLLRLFRGEAARLNNAERFDTARPLYERAWAIAMELHGADHEETQDTLNALAVCEYNRGDHARALAHYERLLGSVLRAYGPNDTLCSITRDSVERCRQFVDGARPMNVAEIVFRSYFPNEVDYARFKAMHDVKVSFGDRLDPDGSLVCVGRPVAEYPMSVEHMPGGVLQGSAPKAWTLQTVWITKGGARRIDRRHDDGSIVSEMQQE